MINLKNHQGHINFHALDDSSENYDRVGAINWLRVLCTCILMILISLSFSPVLSAQILLQEDFDEADLGAPPEGWNSQGLSAFVDPGQSCSGNGKGFRMNQHSGARTNSLDTPTLPRGAGPGKVLVSFDLRVADWNDNTQLTGNGSASAQLFVDGAYTRDFFTLSPIALTPCETKRVFFDMEDVPLGTNFKIRFEGKWNFGDWSYVIDNVIINVPCPRDLILSSSINGDKNYKASSTINSSQSINSNASIVYDADKFVELEEAFQVDTPATLEVKLDGCEANVQELLDAEYLVQELLDAGMCPLDMIDAGVVKDSLYGKTYQGGLIFYLDVLDTLDIKGLVADPSDQGRGAPWGCREIEIVGADGTAIGTGSQNTMDIVNGCTIPNIAARLCNELDLNGYTDWFLPSKDELYEMYKNLHRNGCNASSPDCFGTKCDDSACPTSLGGFANPFYWSSSEISAYHAWSQLFNDGEQDNRHKNTGFTGVRAIRAF